MKRVATHQNPDAAALVSAWLASRYLFDDRRVEVAFVARGCSVDRLAQYDCVVDLSCIHDPERLIFDHKPPAFANRNETCATRLVWKHLLSLRRPVEHLASLVSVVHEGDSNPPRRPSAALTASRKDGLHAIVRQARTSLGSDKEVFQAVNPQVKEAATARISRAPSSLFSRRPTSLFWTSLSPTSPSAAPCCNARRWKNPPTRPSTAFSCRRSRTAG